MRDFSNLDSDYMNLTLDISEQGLGKVWPNPSVGCVIRKGNSVVAVGRTSPDGVHAEVIALEQALGESNNATAYISLEPCSHYGRTPPCTKSLLEAGVKKVFVALRDPSLSVSGLDVLNNSGIETIEGLCADRAKEIHKGFLLRVKGERPLVVLKMATSLDGRIGTVKKETKWISCAQSRREMRVLRSNYDGILSGIGSVLADDPILTSRENEKDITSSGLQSPIRIVLDGRNQMPLDARLLKTAAAVPLWIFTQEFSEKDQNLKAAGARVFYQEGMGIRNILKTLAAQGITRLLVEGGPKIWTSLLKEGLVDEVMWVRMPILMGGDGLPVLHALGVEKLEQALRFHLTGMKRSGGCMIEFYKSCV